MTLTPPRIHLEGLNNEVAELEVGLKAAQEVVAEGGLVGTTSAASPNQPASKQPSAGSSTNAVPEPTSPPPSLPGAHLDTEADRGIVGGAGSGGAAQTPPAKASSSSGGKEDSTLAELRKAANVLSGGPSWVRR